MKKSMHQYFWYIVKEFNKVLIIYYGDEGEGGSMWLTKPMELDGGVRWIGGAAQGK